MPIYYQCQRCAACGRWPGQARLSEAEISAIAAYWGISDYACIQRHTRLRTDRQGLCLEEKPNGQCIFLDGTECLIQAVKPRQCRAFPNSWNFPGFDQLCAAVPRTVSQEEYDQSRREEMR